jgi:hypothetical protein
VPSILPEFRGHSTAVRLADSIVTLIPGERGRLYSVDSVDSKATVADCSPITEPPSSSIKVPHRYFAMLTLCRSYA